MICQELRCLALHIKSTCTKKKLKVLLTHSIKKANFYYIPHNTSPNLTG